MTEIYIRKNYNLIVKNGMVTGIPNNSKIVLLNDQNDLGKVAKVAEQKYIRNITKDKVDIRA